MRKIFSYLTPYLIFLLTAFFSLTIGQMKDFANDPGVGWHLKTGETIVHTRSIPFQDSFLYFADGPRAWISDQWLSDVVLYSIYQIGNWPLLYCVLTLVYLFTFYVLLYRVLGKYETGEVSALLACFLALKLAAVHFILRPVIFSFLFFALTLNLIHKILLTRKITRREWIGIPLMFMAWANMHPSFMLGLMLLGLAWFHPVIERFFLGKNPPKRLVDKLVLLTGICFLVTLINPYGYSLHKSIMELSRSDYFMNLNQEWRPMLVGEGESSFFQILLLGIFLGAIVAGPKRLLLGPFEVFALIAFTHLGLTSVRFLTYFALVAALPFAKACVGLAESIFIEKFPLLSFLIPSPNAQQKNSKRAGTPEFWVLSLVLLVSASFFHIIPGFSGMYGPNEKFPHHAVQYLKKVAHERGQTLKVLSTPDWGGFLTWSGGGHLKPLIDDRNTLNGEQRYKDYFKGMKPGPDLEPYIRSMGAELLLLPANDTLGRYLSSVQGSRPIYTDEVAVVFDSNGKW